MYERYISTLIYVFIFLTGPQAAESSCDVIADAKLIVDSNRAELIVMRIVPFRCPEERKKINDQVRQTGTTPLIDEKTYMPAAPGSLPYLDLCYVLLYNDKITILSRYMAYFLEGKDESLIIIIMLLVDDMPKFIKAYDDLEHKDSFGKTCEAQRKPFQNMLKVWSESTRPADGPVDQAAADKEACALLDEKPKWDETRDQLEKVLMKSSYALAKAILTKYEEKNKHPIEDDIKAIIKNKDLVDAYSSLATYIKDKYKCLATKLHEQSNSNDYWATWNIMIGIFKPDEWKQINDSFKKDNDNIGVVEFISKNILGDFVLMETFAHLIDSSYKPKFLDMPPPVASTPLPLPPPVNPTPGGPPAPVSPTTVVPTVQPGSPAPTGGVPPQGHPPTTPPSG